MSDHLPECLMSETPPLGWRCICDRLRQAEQRGMSESAVVWATQGREQFDLGYAAGVQAAREAVEALNNVTYETALAAIDALFPVSPSGKRDGSGNGGEQ